MAENNQMSSEEYYQHYLEETQGKTSNKPKQTEEKKSSYLQTIILILFIFSLLIGLFYFWQEKNNQENKVLDTAKKTISTTPITPTITMQELEKIDTRISKQKEELKSLQQANNKAEKDRLDEIQAIKKEELAEKKLEKEKLEKSKIAKEKLAKEKRQVEIQRIAAEKKIAEKNRLAKIEAIKKEKYEKKEMQRRNEAKVVLTKKYTPEQKEIQNLELSLLSGLKVSEIPSSTTKKIDTFNKMVLNRKPIPQDTSKELIKMMSKPDKQKDAYTKALKAEAKIREDEMRYVVVKEGDTLFYIAKRIYGDAMLYTIIFEANPDILNDPAHISIGQKLRVPKPKEPSI